jgi:hypothetical protein
MVAFVFLFRRNDRWSMRWKADSRQTMFLFSLTFARQHWFVRAGASIPQSGLRDDATMGKITGDAIIKRSSPLP